MPGEDVGARDCRWMAEALAEARLGLGKTSPNPPVGCVLVKGGRLLARGHHHKAGGPHAEVEAIAAAGRRARGATVYVTLEPCCHFGRTAPCTDALMSAGVALVVVGCTDPSPAVAGRGIRRLRRSGVDVRVGVLREQCCNLIRGFRQWILNGTPWVGLKLASSLDGRIAARGGASKWISCSASRKRVQEMRARSDAVLVGIGTVLADDPRLTCRVREAKNPLRVVLDHELRTSPLARVVGGRGSCLIVCSPGAPTRRRRRLEAAGAEVLELDTHGRRGWHRLLESLGRRTVLELLIEGGARVAASALRARVVNGLTIFYNPRIIGGDGVPMVGPLGVLHPRQGVRLETVACEPCGVDLFWEGSCRL